MGRYKFLSWYRLKSNQDHLFLKISGKGYLEDQPETFKDAEAFARETIEETREIHTILDQDKRGLVVILDLRECEFEDVDFVCFARYAPMAANQGLAIERVEVIGAGSWWRFINALLPKYVQERIVLVNK